MATEPHILVFDSGLGGLSVARTIRAQAPATRLSYAADTAGFPYGDWDEEDLRTHLVALIGRLIERARPDVVVIACNTASVVALAALRAAYPAMSFVGTVPAIKPAAMATASGTIGVLATPSTVRREYTRALIDTYASHRRVVLHGAEGLARLAEEKLLTGRVDGAKIAAEIAPVFVEEDGGRTDTLVLGCTHYPLIGKEIAAAAPWPVRLIDPSPAIARRALTIAATTTPAPDTPSGLALLTREPDARLRALLAREGFGEVGVV